MTGVSAQVRDLERLAMVNVALGRDHKAATAARAQKMATRVVTVLSCTAVVLAVYDLSLILL